MDPPKKSSLPQEYQKLLELTQEKYRFHVHLLQELKGGKTGALLFLASINQAEDSRLEHYILKLDTIHKHASTDESSRHHLVQSNSPVNFSQQHLAQLIYQARKYEHLAAFYSIAGGSLLQFRPLAHYNRQNQLETIFRSASACLLGDWNVDLTFNQAVHPCKVLETWLGYRLKADGRIAGFLENVLRIEPDISGFLIDNQVYPNPLSYSRKRDLWEGIRPIDVITGRQHGDLNIGNILVKFEDDGMELAGFYLIDFALYKEDMPLLFDQRYLEMSYLLRELERTSLDKWVSLISQYAFEDTPGPSTVPVELSGACAVINAGRDEFSRWLESKYSSLWDDIWGQFWLAGAAAGLNFCNKSALSNVERLAGLVYAAAHMKRFCQQFGVPLPADVRPLYDDEFTPGLHFQEVQAASEKVPLPVGMVTFLFTDITGSTKLWENYPRDMPAALEKHNAVIKQVSEVNHGYIFKGTGDGFCIVFQHAAEAVAAAVESQQRLQTLSWQKTGPLQVRMAVYSGGAEYISGDYFGPIINRVARLLEAGHGGQILISESTKESLDNQDISEYQCADLGEHWLKDVPQPEHIYQVSAHGLPKEFPPLLSVIHKPGQLPQSGTTFIGRQEEIFELSQLVHEHRLVTLCGPGGIGKTRLALVVADTLAEIFRDGAYFVQLLAVDSPTGIVPSIAEVLGITFLEGRTPQAQLVEYLQSRQVLLVLDNMEQLLVAGKVEETLKLVESMLNSAPELNLILTSRELLRLPDEFPFIVRGLSIGDHEMDAGLVDDCAVELFHQRASEVLPSFNLSEENNLHLVQEFCLMVEGMPLAIELAAAQLRLLPLAEICSEIKANLEVLDTGLRGESSRHSSIQAVFENSWGSLDDRVQSTFSRLSVFRGGFTLSAASKVAGASIHELTKLTDKSFISRDIYGRFTLHALMHMFAAEKLSGDPDIKDQTQERHFVYYMDQLAGAVNQWRDSRQEAYFDDVKREVDNLKAAWNWVIASGDWVGAANYSENLWHFFKVMGRLPEIMEMLSEALSAGLVAQPPAIPIILARWERHVGQAHLSLSHLTQADRHFRMALSYLGWSIPTNRPGLLVGLISQLSLQMVHRAFPKFFIGRLEKYKESIEEAYIAYENIVTRSAIESDTLLSSYSGMRSLNLAESGRIPPLMARAYTSAGFMFGLIPSFILADSYFNKAEKIIQQEYSPETQWWFSMLSGYYSFGKGEFHQAEQSTELAAKVAGELGKHWEKDNSLILLLGIALFRGEWQRSLMYKERLADSACKRGDAGCEAAALYWEATVNLSRGEMDGVLDLLEESAAAPGEVMMIFDWLIVRSSLARTYVIEGDIESALIEVKELDKLLSSISRPSGSAYIHGYAGTVKAFLDLLEHEQDEHKRRDLQAPTKRALEKFKSFSRIFPIGLSNLWLYQGKYEMLFGARKKALRAWQKSLDSSKDLDLEYHQGLAHYEIGCHLMDGELTDNGWDAESHLRHAERIFTDFQALYDLQLAQQALGLLSS